MHQFIPRKSSPTEGALASTVSLRTRSCSRLIDFVHFHPNSISLWSPFLWLEKGINSRLWSEQQQFRSISRNQLGTIAVSSGSGSRGVALPTFRLLQQPASSPSHNTPVFPCLFRPLFLPLLYILASSGLGNLSLSILPPFLHYLSGYDC